MSASPLVLLESMTEHPRTTIVRAYKACVGKDATWDEDDTRLSDELRRLVMSRHESPLEHVSMTFRLSGVSRVLLAQLTRHRIASFSVESQRYCAAGEDYVTPASVKRDAHFSYIELMMAAQRYYKDAIACGVPEEDARYCLPQAVTTTIVMTMNLRELAHFLGERRCAKAQWEIRAVADLIGKVARTKLPEVFNEDTGYGEPKCDRLGYCPERNSCGRMSAKKT